jgi:hypothetical protein
MSITLFIILGSLFFVNRILSNEKIFAQTFLFVVGFNLFLLTINLIGI